MRGLVKVQFKLPAEVSKQGSIFVSFCPLLDVYSQGKTKRKAIDNLKEALKLFIESCYQRGTLGKVLRKSGFKTVDNGSLVDSRHDYVNVPISLIARNHAEARAN